MCSVALPSPAAPPRLQAANQLPYTNGHEVLLVRPNTKIPVTVTFSEPVFAFTVDDINSINGSIGSLVGSSGDAVYTFNVTPNGLGEVMVDIYSAVAVDADGNGSTAAPRLSLGLPYDDDNDGAISGGEVLTAVSDYFKGLITAEQILAMVSLYFSSLS